MKRIIVYILIGVVVFLFLDFILPSNEVSFVPLKPKYVEDPDYILLFVGDVMLSRGVGAKIDQYNDSAFPFQKIYQELNAADLTFGNLESPISTRGENMGSIYSFRANPKVIKGLTLSGFDVLSIANNHILDYGGLALSDTIDLLKEKGILAVGAGRSKAEANTPVIIELNDLKIGFLAYTTLYPRSMEASQHKAGVSALSQAIEVIKTLKNSVDLLVVSLHWGEEYERRSNIFQKSLGRELIDSGVDIIIGHHPHVTQEIEQYGNGWIAYSLGNFVFDQTFSRSTKEGFILKAIIKDKKIESLVPVLVNITEEYQTEMTTNK